MLEVLPIQAKIEQEAICARCGVEYDADCMAYRATIDGVLTGICQFRMSDRGGVIRDLATVQGQTLNDRDRVESLFVLGRATLNFIAKRKRDCRWLSICPEVPIRQKSYAPGIPAHSFFRYSGSELSMLAGFAEEIGQIHAPASVRFRRKAYRWLRLSFDASRVFITVKRLANGSIQLFRTVTSCEQVTRTAHRGFIGSGRVPMRSNRLSATVTFPPVLTCTG